jgi:hypothetical protein
MTGPKTTLTPDEIREDLLAAIHEFPGRGRLTTIRLAGVGRVVGRQVLDQLTAEGLYWPPDGKCLPRRKVLPPDVVGLSHVEAARRLGISERTVRRIRRGGR